MNSLNTLQKFGVTAGLILCYLILLRLVWVQTRPYGSVGPTAAWFNATPLPQGCRSSDIDTQVPGRLSAGPGIELGARSLWAKLTCKDASFRRDRAQRHNQGLLISTILVTTALTRLATGSWLIALLAATWQLSRGRLLATVGDTSWLGLYAPVLALWVSNLYHYLRSGAPLSLGTLHLWALILIVLDPIFLGLLLPLPLFALIVPLLIGTAPQSTLRHLRERLQSFVSSRPVRGFTQSVSETLFGRFIRPPLLEPAAAASLDSIPGMLRDLGQPFFLWQLEEQRWQKLAKQTSLGGALCVLVAVLIWPQGLRTQILQLGYGLNHGWISLWLKSLGHAIDIDLQIVFLMLGCAFLLPSLRGLASLWELLLLLAIAAPCVLGLALAADAYWAAMGYSGPVLAPQGLSRAPRLLVVAEPLLLSLGIAAFVHGCRIIANTLRQLLR